MNQNSQCILSEQDVVQAWLNDTDIISAVFDNPSVINTYNDWCKEEYHDKTIGVEEEYVGDDYVEKCTSNWYMPDEYKQLNVYNWLLDRCTTDVERNRVSIEYAEFDRRGLADVLRFLKYLVDVCKENNIVLGVGRGSSVASYCLYLLGVHKIDSLKYNLDIGEFLK